MTDTRSPQRDAGAALRGFLGVPLRPQTYRNLAYLALAFPLGLAYFVAVVSGLSTGVGLAVTLVGVPLVVLTVAAATALAGFEARLAAWLGVADVAPPRALRELVAADLGSADGLLDATKRLLAAPTTWTSLLFVLLKFVFGIVAFSALVTAVAVAGTFLTMPLFYDATGVAYTVGPYVVDTLPEALAGSALGVPIALVSLHLLNGLARLHGFATATLLGSGDPGDDGNDGDAGRPDPPADDG
jgi:hypothetical protein